MRDGNIGDALVSTAKKDQNHIVSKLHFKDADIHVEFLLPEKGPGNSGVYIHGNYEAQNLNSFGKEKVTQEDAGASLISATGPAARRLGQDHRERDRHRVVQREEGPDGAQFGEPKSTFHPFRFANTPYLDKIRDQQKMTMTGPVFLQDHGNPVKFRNVWVLPADDRATVYEPGENDPPPGLRESAEPWIGSAAQ